MICVCQDSSCIQQNISRTNRELPADSSVDQEAYAVTSAHKQPSAQELKTGFFRADDIA